MLISPELNQLMNAQVGNEFGASHQYLCIANHFEQQSLKLLGKLFFKQAEEEHEHAMKFVHYIVDVGGDFRIPAVKAPKPTFASAAEAVEAALNWENEVTRQIVALMDQAVKDKDYLAQNFLKWFIDEQLEEINKMQDLLSVVKRAGEQHLIMVEAYIAHLDAD
jgi:ferritin